MGGCGVRVDINIDEEFRDLIPPLSADERAQLEQNILANGCRDPLVVWCVPAPNPGEHKCYAHDESKCDLRAGDGVWTCAYCNHNPALLEYVLLDGHNRLDICRRHGIEFKTEELDFDSRDDAKLWIVQNQLGRRNLTDFVKAELALIAKPIIEKKARAAKLASLKQGDAIPARLNSDERDEAIRTDTELAKIAGVGKDTVRKVEQIKKTASPELLAAVRSGEVSIHAAADIATLLPDRQASVVESGKVTAAAKEIRAQRADEQRSKRVKKILEISKGNAPLGQIAERYPVIYADPPWRYEHIETESRAIENQYPTMALDEIKALDLDAIALDDCVLFMWATSPKLGEAFEVLRAWGFKYRTCAVWDKQKIGMGYYFRQQHELLLVAVRGQPMTPAPANRPSSVLSFPRGEHSAKPVEVYELIEAMYPELPKLEMFCRSPRDGWGAWGNQAAA